MESFLKAILGTIISMAVAGIIWGASLTGTVSAQGEVIKTLQRDTALVDRMALQLNYLTRQYCMDNGWGNCPEFIQDSLNTY